MHSLLLVRKSLVAFVTIVAAYLFTAVSYAASIEVVEAEPEIVTENGVHYSTATHGGTKNESVIYQTNTQGAVASTISTELYVQLQALQVEVQNLRGVVEEQAYLIEQLGQRRMDDYLDLDRRIGELHGLLTANSATSMKSKPKAARPYAKPVEPPKAVAKPSSASPSAIKQPIAKPAAVLSTAPPAAKLADQADRAKVAYRHAYQYVKQRKFDDAKFALIAFIGDYSQSQYVPNAYFWLGELYYLESDLKKSRNAFTSMVSEFPSHRKVPDAKFKLGKIYHQLGDNAQAKVMLKSVLAEHPNSKAVNPSSEYLKNSLR